MDVKNKRVFNQLNLVVFLTSGKITSLKWDIGCYGCEDTDRCANDLVSSFNKWDDDGTSEDSEYKHSNCYVPECQETDTTCDLKVYVSWMGTDANDHYMISAGQRLSAFSNQNIGSLLESMQNLEPEDVPNKSKMDSEVEKRLEKNYKSG